MCLDPGALEFLNHKTPARGGFQRECRPVVARKAREPAAQVLPGGGTDLSAKDFAGLCLCVVEGDLLPMHVESTYNVHPGPPQAPSADNNALMISGSSAFELRRLLYMSSFRLASLVGDLSHRVRMIAPDETWRELLRTHQPVEKVVIEAVGSSKPHPNT